MPLHSEIKELLIFLNQNPQIRKTIRAAPNKTLLYAGHFFKPVWQEIENERRVAGLSFDKIIYNKGIQIKDSYHNIKLYFYFLNIKE